jgi:trimeric autotransporter adhesin
MANRVPLILDIQDQNRIKELPVGDSLDLTGSSIVNVTNLEVLGNLNVPNLVVDYSNLSNAPTIPTTLTDIGITDGTADQVLSTDGAGNFTFVDPVTVALNVSKLSELQNDTGFITQADLANGTYEIKNIGSLVGSVFAEDSTLLVDGINGTIDYGVIINTPNIPSDIYELNDSLGLLGGSFSGSYNDLTDKPDIPSGSYNDLTDKPTNVSAFTNDAGYLTSETDSQTLTFDGTNLTISNGNSVNLSSLAVTVDTGNIGFDTNTIYNLEVGTEPILIAPDLGDADASIYLPASNSAETLLISNDSGGGVSITGNAGDIVVNSANDVDIESTSSSGRINFNINGSTEAWVDSTGFNVGILTGNLEGNITGNVTASTITTTTIAHNVANSTEITIGSTSTTDARLRSGTSSVNIADDNTGTGVITLTAPEVNVVGTLSATAISSTGTGTSELIATTNLELSAGVAVVITQSPFRLASVTTTARDLLVAVNGDMIYNETVNKFQGYQNGSWINLDGTV